MIPLIVILIIEILFCFIAYIHTNGVLVQPTFLTFLVLTISTVFGVIGNITWEVDVSYFTILVVAIGFSMILLADIVGKRVTCLYKYKEKI